MIVVADTSPLNYLVRIDAIDILPKMYGEVVAPHVVLSELTAEGSPPIVAAWASDAEVAHPRSTASRTCEQAD